MRWSVVLRTIHTDLFRLGVKRSTFRGLVDALDDSPCFLVNDMYLTFSH